MCVCVCVCVCVVVRLLSLFVVFGVSRPCDHVAKQEEPRVSLRSLRKLLLFAISIDSLIHCLLLGNENQGCES